MSTRYFNLTATEAARGIATGELSARDYVESCLSRVAELEPHVHAWSWIDPEHARAQAEAVDRARASGKSVGPLAGVPVGIKDVFDTFDMPTEYGSPIFSGRRPSQDSTAVRLLRQADAVIMGKTVTNPFACGGPTKTANPLDFTRTPGASSSGSAAAVAARMVPVAVGTQFQGSIIRPASYCGIYGFKPTFGAVSRYGSLIAESDGFVHVGVMARSIEDIGRVMDEIAQPDALDPSTRHQAPWRVTEQLRRKMAKKPRLAFVRSPVWDLAAPDLQREFVNFVESLGEIVEEVELPREFDRAIETLDTIMAFGAFQLLRPIFEKHSDEFSEVVRALIEKGEGIDLATYEMALDQTLQLRRLLSESFLDFDAIVTPATTGEAPVGLETTGSPAFCMIWSMCHVPSITIPALHGESGMPIGVQLVGKHGQDGKLLRIGRWLDGHVRGIANQSPASCIDIKTAP